ncbi:MAG: S-layer homology domain-containing protein [Oscillospiraceae bacterium]|nr:S-layer homology domain-containing protein [Oscillospiraceae bacterium]
MAASNVSFTGISSLSDDTFSNLGFNTCSSEISAQAASSVSPYGNGYSSLIPNNELLYFSGTANKYYDTPLTSSKTSSSYYSKATTASSGAMATRSVAFDPLGSGQDEYVAMVSATVSSKNVTTITLTIIPPSGNSVSKKIVDLPFYVFPENAGAYLSVVAGNFDGDSYGKDEIAIYAPFSGSTSSGSIEIYSVTKSSSKLSINSVKSLNLRDQSSWYFYDDDTLTVTPADGYGLEKLTVTSEDGGTLTLTYVSSGVYTFDMPSSDVTVAAVFSSGHDCSSALLNDIDAEAWYHEYIDYVVDNGLMTGTSATTFEPDTATTRGMIATMLHRLESEPTASAAHSFGDVASASYYEQSIAWAEENGIVQGYGDGTFRPDDAITREQLAAILYRYAQYKGYDVSIGEDTNILSYNDAAEISEYAVPALQWAVGAGLIEGTATATLAPQQSATRAQVAAILMRFIESVFAD